MIKKILKWTVVAVIAVVAGLAGFVWMQIHGFDSSISRVYDIPPLDLKRSDDPMVITRGKHLAESIGGCATADCHGNDLSGGRTIAMGPVATLVAPNITPGGRMAMYSDGELARLIVHGVKHDGTSARFMTVEDFDWLPDSDVQALVSYVRSVLSVPKPDGEMTIGPIGKVLDRFDQLPFDVARRVDHQHRASPPAPEPTAKYGGYIALMCYGCHGHGLSGGPIPGAPKDMAIPANITPDPSGIKDYTFEDFNHLIETGIKRNGKHVADLMPVEALRGMDDTERHALWAFLQTVPPKPYGQR